MKFRDVLSMCLSNLLRRKGRTFLSVLGVIVGCCSIVVMVSIGVGMSASQEALLGEMGDLTAIDVYGSSMADVKLNEDLVSQIKVIEHVKTVAAKYTADMLNLRVTAGSNDRYVTTYPDIAAYDDDAMRELDYQLIEGTLPEKKGTVAIGENLEYMFQDSKRPEGRNTISIYDENTGEELTGADRPGPYVNLTDNSFTISVLDEDGKAVYSEEFKVVGRFKSDYNVGGETDSGFLMRSEDFKSFYNNAMKATNQKNTALTYGSIKVFADDIDNVTDVETSIQGLGCETSSMQSMRESTQKEMATVQLALGGIGAVSLLVAAIGIMNTMIMSVSERTKEIGIMKALGCYVSDIRKLFLLEAASIGLLGGIVGSVLSYVISVVINIVYAASGNAGEITGGMAEYLLTSSSRISVIPIWLLLFGLVFSTLIGLVSGAYPAVKAVKISPLEAMKNE